MDKRSIYNIIEVANTHGGSKEYLLELLNEFSEFEGGFGVKFQPFKYDEIATEDYEWYKIYTELFFTPEEWSEIIQYASKTKSVWLDLSGTYSCSILEQNKEYIAGFKLQSSILFSDTIYERLQQIDVSQLTAVMNIAGLSMEEIGGYVTRLTTEFDFKELVLQIGFQNYPTDFFESGISKIQQLKDQGYAFRISFADHISPEFEDCRWVPVVAGLSGASIIEKHVKHSSFETKYDHFSSMDVNQYRTFIETQAKYQKLLQQDFLSANEELYLDKTKLFPIIEKPLRKGQLIAASDISFKRTSKTGIGLDVVKSMQQGFHMLSADKAAEEPIYSYDFKKASIAVIIACRLKSTRLPQKAIREVKDGLTSVELCQKNAKRIRNVNHVILATSDNEEDAKLGEYVFDGVKFHTGDPVDVIDRYQSIIDKLDIDVVIRMTGDCPYPSDEIMQFLLESHFASGADYTQANKSVVGADAQIINAQALRRVKELFPVTDYSEYMNGYIIYNPDHFKLNNVDLPEELVRDYRLTLDYPEDLELIKRIEAHFDGQETYAFKDVIQFLDEHPEVAGINKDMGLIYQTDPELKERIRKATTYVG